MIWLLSRKNNSIKTLLKEVINSSLLTIKSIYYFPDEKNIKTFCLAKARTNSVIPMGTYFIFDKESDGYLLGMPDFSIEGQFRAQFLHCMRDTHYLEQLDPNVDICLTPNLTGCTFVLSSHDIPVASHINFLGQDGLIAQDIIDDSINSEYGDDATIGKDVFILRKQDYFFPVKDSEGVQACVVLLKEQGKWHAYYQSAVLSYDPKDCAVYSKLILTGNTLSRSSQNVVYRQSM